MGKSILPNFELTQASEVCNWAAALQAPSSRLKTAFTSWSEVE